MDIIDWLLNVFGSIVGQLLGVLFTLTDFLVNLVPGVQSLINAISAPISFIGSIPSLLVYATHISPFIWNALIFIVILTFTWKPIVALVKWSIDVVSKIFGFLS